MPCNHRGRLIAAALAIQFLAPTAVAADEVVLDLATALARAAAHAPDAVAARGRIGEAEATRVGADVRFTDNPEVEVEAGPRRRDAITTDVSVRIGQTFPLGGRRAARRAVADATVAHARAAADGTVLALQVEAADAFLQALHAARVVDAARGAEALAVRAAEVAGRRRGGGELTDLDVDLARVAAGRARSAVRAAEAEQAAALGRLAARVGAAAGDTLVLRGELRPEGAPRVDRAAGERRADVRALEAEAVVADGELRLAGAGGRPDLGLWVGYAREEDADVFVGGLRLTLPIWERGQGGRAGARARAARATAEAAAVRRGAAREVVDAMATYQRAREAVEVFEADVLPVLGDGEALLERSVEAGTLAVGDYLVARQELFEGRREYLDRLLALASAHVRAELAAGGRR